MDDTLDPMPDSPIEVDPTALDILARRFLECRALGIAISGELPLGTPEHQRAACVLLGRAISTWRDEHGRQPGW